VRSLLLEDEGLQQKEAGSPQLLMPQGGTITEKGKKEKADVENGAWIRPKRSREKGPREVLCSDLSARGGGDRGE